MTAEVAGTQPGRPVEPVEPRDAATVLLLRPGTTAPLDVFVMVRRLSMEFAAGVVAFPGGGVDTVDSAPVDPSWVARLGAHSHAQAAGVIGAAVRELAEETGVVVPISDLGLWDAWTTPELVPKRYRTWFFTAVLPAGQEPEELSTESSSVEWISPAAALDRADAGVWSLMPPTYSSLLRLATFDSVESVMAATREASVEMFTPVVTDGGVRLPAWASALAAERPGARWR